MEQSYAELQARVLRWTDGFNTYIQPILEESAQKVVDAHVAQTSPTPAIPNAGENAGSSSSYVSDPSPCLDNVLPKPFPLRSDTVPEPMLKGEAQRASKGYPPLRNSEGQSELWREVNDINIPLPSAFDPRVLSQPLSKELVELELAVRKIQANDALENLRTYIIASEKLKIDKFDAACKAVRTRMTTKIRTNYSQISSSANDYCRARLALIALGLDEKEPLFRPLCKSDCKAFIMANDRAAVGQSKQHVSWIWDEFKVGERPDDGKFKEFYDDGMYF